jgi:hypothetical protein
MTKPKPKLGGRVGQMSDADFSKLQSERAKRNRKSLKTRQRILDFLKSEGIDERT